MKYPVPRKKNNISKKNKNYSKVSKHTTDGPKIVETGVLPFNGTVTRFFIAEILSARYASLGTLSKKGISVFTSSS